MFRIVSERRSGCSSRSVNASHVANEAVNAARVREIVKSPVQADIHKHRNSTERLLLVELNLQLLKTRVILDEPLNPELNHVTVKLDRVFDLISVSFFIRRVPHDA